MSRANSLLFIAAASLILAASTAALASEPGPNSDDERDVSSGLAMAADLVIARPLGLVATVVGSVFLVIGVPFEAMSGDFTTPAERLVVEPARYTFVRPLGQFN